MAKERNIYKKIKFWKLFIIPFFIWTLLLSFSLFWNISEINNNFLKLIKTEAISSFNKDIIYRKWAANHGGVYVKVTNDIQPNPYLVVNKRDLIIDSSFKLTLINPAYMTRQVHEMSSKLYGNKGHITSLNPINPNNKPDLWEKIALEKFEKGDSEICEISKIDSIEYLRLIKPLVVEKSCLKCHAIQGYKIGDIRGAISVSIPTDQYNQISKNHIFKIIFGHIFIWFVGLLGIIIFLIFYKHKLKEKQNFEKQILDSENKYKTIFNNSSDGITINTIEGRYLEVNDKICKILKYSKRELLNLTPSNLDIRIIEDKIFEERIKLILKNGFLSFETIIKTKDNELIPFDVNCSLIEYNNQKAVLSVIRDITERKKIEYNQKRLSDILKASKNEIYIFDAETLKFQFINEGALQNLGYSFEQLLNFTPLNLKPDFTLASFMFLINPLLNREKEFIVYETIHLRANGTTYPVEINLQLTNYDEKQYFLAIVQDITERKKTEIALKESEEKFKNVILQSSDGFSLVDDSCKIIEWNPALEKITGYSKSEFFHQSAIEVEKILIDKTEISDLTNYNKIDTLYKTIFSQKYIPENIKYIEGKIICKNKEIKYVSISAFLINTANCTYLGKVVRDLTDKRNSEDLKLKLKVSDNTAKFKQQFLANMSHEMRTPMNGIIGMIEFLQKTSLNETQIEYTNTIKNSSETLLNLLNDILLLSKIEAGKLELHNSAFNIHHVIQNIKSLFSALVKHKNIKFVSKYTNKVPDYIIADKHKLIQILSNLVSNAVKFTEEGEITVEFSILKCLKNNKVELRVDVIDTGIGIDNNFKERIFETFSQADNSNTRIHEGAGLGLSITKQLVELMNGKLFFESEIGKGTTFSFTFEAEIATAEKIIIEEEVKNNKKLNKSLNILLVEDKIVNQKVVELMLKNLNAKIKIANNGKIALDFYEESLITKQKFDLILMDIQMPIMDGETAVKTLIEIYKKENLPIIIGLSANAMEGDEEHYISIGMDDYLVKPLSMDKLNEKLSKWFGE